MLEALATCRFTASRPRKARRGSPGWIPARGGRADVCCRPGTAITLGWVFHSRRRVSHADGGTGGRRGEGAGSRRGEGFPAPWHGDGASSAGRRGRSCAGPRPSSLRRAAGQNERRHRGFGSAGTKRAGSQLPSNRRTGSVPGKTSSGAVQIAKPLGSIKRPFLRGGGGDTGGIWESGSCPGPRGAG